MTKFYSEKFPKTERYKIALAAVFFGNVPHLLVQTNHFLLLMVRMIDAHPILKNIKCLTYAFLNVLNQNIMVFKEFLDFKTFLDFYNISIFSWFKSRRGILCKRSVTSNRISLKIQFILKMNQVKFTSNQGLPCTCYKSELQIKRK